MGDYVRKTKRILLECGHMVEFFPPTPFVGDQVFCYRHNTWKVVAGGDAVEKPLFRLTCRDCPYARKFHISIYDPRVAGETHSLRHSHTLEIRNKNGDIISVIKP